MTRYQFIDDSGETRLAGTLEPDPGGSSAVLSATLPLSGADILSLHTTPITVVPGVDGFAFIPTLPLLVVRPGVTPYAGSYTLRLFNSDTTYGASGWGGGIGLNNGFNHVDAGAYFGTNGDDGDYEALTLLDGKPLRFDSNAAITDGDGTATLTVLYAKVALT